MISHTEQGTAMRRILLFCLIRHCAWEFENQVCIIAKVCLSHFFPFSIVRRARRILRKFRSYSFNHNLTVQQINSLIFFSSLVLLLKKLKHGKFEQLSINLDIIIELKCSLENQFPIVVKNITNYRNRGEESEYVLLPKEIHLDIFSLA